MKGLDGTCESGGAVANGLVLLLFGSQDIVLLCRKSIPIGECAFLFSADRKGISMFIGNELMEIEERIKENGGTATILLQILHTRQ